MDLVNSIVKAVRVLDTLSANGPLGYAEILRRVALPKSTLSKIMATLEAEGLVSRDPQNGRYQMGVKLIEWGSGARAQIEMRKVAGPVMKALSEKLDCTVHLTLLAHNEVLPIESVESGTWYWHHFKYPVAIGIPAPIHATGAGKAILAFLERGEVESIVREKGLRKYTENTITDLATLWLEIEKIRAVGHAVSNAEHDELIRSVAAPIWNHDGKVIGALSALGIVSRFTPDRLDAIAAEVVKAAAEISRRIGYSPDGALAKSRAG